MCTQRDLPSIESRIADLIRRHTAPEDEPVAPACRPVLDGVADQAVASSEGGKRLRARLALAAYEAAGVAAGRGAHAGGPGTGAYEAMLDLACAIEVFQTAALVHDDIIDDSDLRRGRPSAHRALSAATSSGSIGRGLGIMLGDLLATASVDIANAAARGFAASDAIVGAFLTMHREVEIGQVLDLAVELAPLDDPQALADASLNVFRWKTASYTTIAPIELALLAAGDAPDRARERALAIGRPLGVAFQLADDLLDVTGASERTGKPVGGDIREGKRTVLLADALGAADDAGRDELTAMFEADARDGRQVRRAIELFDSTGAIEGSRRRIARLWRRTQDAIGALGWDEQATSMLTRACARFVPLA